MSTIKASCLECGFDGDITEFGITEYKGVNSPNFNEIFLECRQIGCRAEIMMGKSPLSHKEVSINDG